MSLDNFFLFSQAITGKNIFSPTTHQDRHHFLIKHLERILRLVKTIEFHNEIENVYESLAQSLNKFVEADIRFSF